MLQDPSRASPPAPSLQATGYAYKAKPSPTGANSTKREKVEGEIKADRERNRAQGRTEQGGDGGGDGEGAPRVALRLLLQALAVPHDAGGRRPASWIVFGRPCCGHGSSDPHCSCLFFSYQDCVGLGLCRFLVRMKLVAFRSPSPRSAPKLVNFIRVFASEVCVFWGVLFWLIDAIGRGLCVNFS